MLLRKWWGSGRFSSSNQLNSSSESSSSFDQIPSDVFLLILKLVGPKGAARMSAVCKSWNSIIVSDNQLWVSFLVQSRHDHTKEAILFSETHLRNGISYDLSHSLTYMHIYGKRAQLLPSVIIDGGSGYYKFGWSNYPCPSGLSPTFLEFGNVESPLYSSLRHFFTTIYRRMKVKPSTQQLIVSVPICHSDATECAEAARRQLKETIYSVLFDMNIPAVCAIDQAVLALISARRVSGIVINIGFKVTSIVPIFHGQVMHQVGVEVVGQGATSLTGFLRDLMLLQNITFESMCTVRTLKEKLCYVAADYEAELSKDTQASLEVPEEGCFTLSKERFQTGEILFKPRMGGVRSMGLHQAVALCMDHCQAAEVTGDDEWFKSIVLAGGTSCLPGLPERLEKELCKLLPPSMSNGIRVIPPQSAESAWLGANVISNLSTFGEAWCLTKKQFRQKGKHRLISRK